LAAITARSATHERLYGDASGPKRNAKAIRERERISMTRPVVACKPEGYSMTMTSPMGYTMRREEKIKYQAKGPITARGRDMDALAAASKKKVRRGRGA